MRETDLLISEKAGAFEVRVSGRANFEYAVPLRSMAQRMSPSAPLKIDLAACEAMDSTFMGVLTMLALKLRKTNQEIQLLNAGENLKKLLKDLGVAKLFRFTDGCLASAGTAQGGNAAASKLTTAQTIMEAHQTLVEAESSNAAKFDRVIEFAEQDVKRLQQEEKR